MNKDQPSKSSHQTDSMDLITSSDSDASFSSSWKQIHAEWIKGTKERKKSKTHVNIDSVMKVLNSEEEGSFEKPIPLDDMVEILNETWEGEGLFD